MYEILRYWIHRAFLSRLSIFLSFVVIGLVFALIGAGIFPRGEQNVSADDVAVLRRVAELFLQLALITTAAVLLKFLIDSHGEKRRDAEQERDRRIEFLCRVRTAHVRVAKAWWLVRAHDSGNIYCEQFKELIDAMTELEEVASELNAAENLFRDSTKGIIRGIEEINQFLRRGLSEYVRCLPDVQRDSKMNKSLSDTITRCSMDWVDNFRRDKMPYDYDNALFKSKEVIRQYVYADARKQRMPKNAQSNADLVRRVYQAFSATEQATLGDLLSPHVVLRISGSNPISGNHEGSDAVCEVYSKIAKLPNGTFEVELENLQADGRNRVTARHRASGERNGKRIDLRFTVVFTIAKGKIVKIDQTDEDQATWDTFLAPIPR